MAENEEVEIREALPFPPTPEHDKLKGREDEHGGIVSFLNWIEEQGYHIGKYVEHENFYNAQFVTISPLDLVAEFFEIDQKAWEKENQAVLEYARSL